MADASHSPGSLPVGFRFAQWRMLLATMFCYLFYYTGRQNFGWATAGIKEELHLGEDIIGLFGTVVLWTYAVGQAVNGNLGDKFGGRTMMSLGAVTSCALNWATSFGRSFWTLMIPWGVNGYAQSLGWAPGGRVVSNWWPRHLRGTAFGCYMAAAACSSILTFGLCIAIVNSGMDWRWIFRLPVLLMLVGGVGYYVVARDRPEDLGFPPLAEGDSHAGQPGEEASLARYLHVMTNGHFAVACVAIGFQNAARYGLLFWVPYHYLGEAWKQDPGTAWIALALPIGTALGALSGGIISDRLFKSNRKWPIAIFMSLCAVLSLAAYAVPVEYRTAGVVILFLAGFCVYAPQASFWPLCPEMLGLRRAGTGVGIMDMYAYVFAGLAQPLIGWLIKRSGDTAQAFLVVAAVSLLSAVCILPVKQHSHSSPGGQRR
jgi:MFS transporter, OPA family, glycerol-3-phosphate transporter